ncbi:MAG: hypothetical protein K0Q94_117 [Paenibacillus sp.]|jgi:hypothetical protein|uniref:hypothetical protein n=1 Tax=Paenibacillus sp. GCM10012303 TaxID=3317340 RepID=UPI0029EEBDFD|nr:hypothetical protein [Paenibacillus sp.]
MIGSYRWNLVLGTLGFALTFILSIEYNFIWRTLMSSVYSFLIIFVAAFALRWILGTLIGLKPQPVSDSGQPMESQLPDEPVGQTVDTATPDDQDQLNEMLKEQLNRSDSEPFVPLQPKKLATVQETEAQELAQAVRHLTEK